ncbi:hypothetical protein M0910_001949 [Listeria monocytogenes]|nr:hypothetical protein [Listeria monocytogenes]EJA0930869.1 hypothetical protein [Listeria monocytogenes]EJA1052368.1 hypothetical protein [Listeria monocytogenes]EJA1073835.1 hypothetical protein [Listeria monocytogenes]EJC8829971.1 hypothetical protein [Listeria monocytogenes]
MVTATKGRVQEVGFNGPTPRFIILWKLLPIGNMSKTICYSEAELEEQLKLHSWKFDGYEVIANADEDN